MSATVLAAVSIIAIADYSRPRAILQFGLLFWMAVLAMVELLPVPVSRVLHLSLGFPITLAVMILYPPFVASTVALLGSFDSRELRGEIRPLTSSFNRSQIALATLAGAEALRLISPTPSGASLDVLIPAAIAATVFRYVVNVSFITTGMRLEYKLPFRAVLSQMRVGAAREFLL